LSKKPREILDLIKSQHIEMVDLKFTDPLGTLQHTTIPAQATDEGTLLDGIGFDGSSIRCFQSIHESDMVMKPDLDTAVVDTFRSVPTLSILCDIFDPVARASYDRDPRFIAKRAEAYLQSTGIADTAYFGPEAEFFIFDSIAYENEPNRTGFEIDSSEGHWNSGIPGLGYTVRSKEGYYPASPVDSQADIRAEMSLELQKWGIEVEMQHHEVATAGQAEIDFRFGPLLKTADNLQHFKYVIKNVARRNNKTATFMPKPLFGDNGSGMHVHQSLWKGGKPLFFDANGYAECSQMMLFYIGGLLTHIDSLLAFCAPTTNSYKRLVPHYEAPVNVAFSARNRSAAIRIPMFFQGNAKAKRLEFRPPDPMANPYLAFSALLLAGLDGIKRQIDPIKAGFGPLDQNIYDLTPEEAARIKSVPGSLEASLNALENDHDYLLEGGVFSRDFIKTYLDYKRTRELQAVAVRPHPYEFSLYYDG
jgi:glutamine synthetase